MVDRGPFRDAFYIFLVVSGPPIVAYMLWFAPTEVPIENVGAWDPFLVPNDEVFSYVAL